MPASPTSASTAPGLLAIPRSAVAFVPDLDDARRLAAELDPSATPTELEHRAHDILCGQLLVIRRDAPLPFDAEALDYVPLCSSSEAR